MHLSGFELGGATNVSVTVNPSGTFLSTRNTFINNEGLKGSAIFSGLGSLVKIINNYFIDNVADMGGKIEVSFQHLCLPSPETPLTLNLLLNAF